MAPGTHLYSVREAHERIADGRSPLLRLVMNKGDVLIRDLLCWHRCDHTSRHFSKHRPYLVVLRARRTHAHRRASPNVTESPRPLMVMSFSPSVEVASKHYAVSPGIQREVYEGLNGQAQHLLRAVPRTEGPPHAATGENGRVHPEPLY